MKQILWSKVNLLCTPNLTCVLQRLKHEIINNQTLPKYQMCNKYVNNTLNLYIIISCIRTTKRNAVTMGTPKGCSKKEVDRFRKDAVHMNSVIIKPLRNKTMVSTQPNIFVQERNQRVFCFVGDTNFKLNCLLLSSLKYNL